MAPTEPTILMNAQANQIFTKAQANENKWGRQNRKEKPFRLIWNRMGVRNKLEQIWSKMRKTCSFGYHFRADRCACEFSHS